MTADEGVPQPADYLARMEELGKTLTQVSSDLRKERLEWEKTAAFGRRTRRLAVGLAISFALDVVLTVVVTLLSLSALNQGNTLHASQLTACMYGNQARTQQITLWNEVLALSAQSPHANTQTDEAFKQFIAKTFAPVDCARIYPN